MQTFRVFTASDTFCPKRTHFLSKYLCFDLSLLLFCLLTFIAGSIAPDFNSVYLCAVDDEGPCDACQGQGTSTNLPGRY